MKKFEQTLTYSGNKVDTEKIDVYDESGTLEETETGTYVYSGNQVVSVEWV